MAATRTQIYLHAEQRRSLDALRRSRGVSLADLIRDAVDAYLAEQVVDRQAVLDSTFGAVPTAEAAPRSEWAERG